MNQQLHKFPVAVVGAGPAGLYAAKRLARVGMPVALINRDIKPGGLAEYGIFHSKHKMKAGLKKQFDHILHPPEIRYFGNLTVDQNSALSLDTLREMGFRAFMVTVGAQGTKWLGLPGEDLTGVYHAKDLVYHYNQLPPYSQHRYPIGDRVALIGAGNVMVDIAHYCVRDLAVKQVTAVVRRGPADVKFDKKEFANIVANLDLASLDAEIDRTAPILYSVEQDPEKAKAFILSALDKAKDPIPGSKFNFRFLSSPTAIIGDQQGRVTGLQVENTTLKFQNGGTRANGLGTTEILPVDTVIFCIGDQVSTQLGLPLNQWKEYAKHPEPRFPIKSISYEAYSPDTDEAVEDVFLAGWAREASSGLVGMARKDGENGATALLKYLETQSPSPNPEGALDRLETHLVNLPGPIVRKDDYFRLSEIEVEKAHALDIERFKFSSNQDMLDAMGLAEMVE